MLGAAGPEFVIAARVPMPTEPVRIEAENFFLLDIQAGGGPPIFLFRPCKGH